MGNPDFYDQYPVFLVLISHGTDLRVTWQGTLCVLSYSGGILLGLELLSLWDFND